MTEKRFKLNKDSEWWTVEDNTIKVNEFGYREDLTGEDAYRGLGQELTEQETVDLLNDLLEKNKELQDFKELWIGQNSILERENKALQESNQELTRRLSAIKIEKINEIIEQNKKLKKQINELMK